MKKGFSKTAFIIISILILLMIIIAPIAGFFAHKILGAIAIGWPLAFILIIILVICISDENYQLNDDFKWKFSNIQKINNSEEIMNKKGGLQL